VTNALDAITSAPYSVRLTLENLEWQMTKEELSKMLTPGENGELDFHNGQFQEWTRRISDTVDRPARDASIEVTNGRVINFTESRDGQSADIDILKKDLLSSVRGQSGEAIELQINIEKPRIETGDANDLGITQALGAGISNYKGSPMNRRANIQNGVNLLNGILIAPGETFSLLKALAPFSTDNGYLPELVIKGDKITPEIGGGLCQIGTTTFRAAMNSGLPIIERQNHSIVVSYYNDPSNGNPGTDATIYEPVPDLKFVNDTADFILFQAENKTETQELKFTFWGTTDGRIGSYSAPTVLRWIPVGEDVRTETSDLEPGTETCQSAHIGADTTFVYTITKLDGTSVQTQFDSHYRPLPKICLVGAEEKTEDETPDVEDQTDSALEN
jgi:vancomycin resistance protein YoaR